MIEKTIVCIDTAQMHKAMRKAVEKGVSPEIAGNKSRFVRHLISEYVGDENAGA
jgi:hypothetical protein